MPGDILPFDLHGDATAPASPVVLSVPHAGRDYPLALRAALRVPLEALRALEDRHVDALALAARGAETCLVQRRARAWIDLNRAEHERDPAIDGGADRQAGPHRSAKVRGGLGLVPRRVPEAGDLWRRRFDGEEVTARIRHDHRPYHDALAGVLAAARRRFGCAILLDLHSMPPLGAGAPRIVLGDRFGRTARSCHVHRLEAIARDAGLTCALNTPYAGGHILDRQARPADGIYAIQVEIDRTLYLDPTLDLPGDGLAASAALMRAMIDALADEALTPHAALAAE